MSLRLGRSGGTILDAIRKTVRVDLSTQPHHDGSPLYVDTETPGLEDHVGVRVHTPEGAAAVWVRTVEDGEPFFTPMEATDENWWAGTVHVRNPVQRYRFMVVEGAGFRWLNAAGVWDHDVPDAHDFTLSIHPKAPDWGRDAVVYQVFPDRFGKSQERPTPAWARKAEWDDLPIHQGPDTPLHFYGGDLDGITEHLDHLERIGADCLYTTPVFPGESNHRYNASTFDEVDPLLGGDEAYRRLIDAAHARDIKVLGDLTSNHTGDTHEWFQRAKSDPDSPERRFYYFDEADGYRSWKGYDTLPKLDHQDPELRRRFAGVVRRWLEFGLDGWRIDVANMTGRHAEVDIALEVARELRQTATAVRPDALVLAEHGHDATGDLDGDGWHGTMNYYGFSFPIWEWLRDPEKPVPSFGLPVDVPRRTGAQAVAAMRAFTASFGWHAVNASWNILSSHDSPRIRTTTGSKALHHLAAALQFTLPGVPMVFAGDELGLEGTDGEDSRRTIAWDRQDDWETDTLDLYARLAEIRRQQRAITRGGLRWLTIQEDRIAFVREHPDGDVLVALDRTLTAPPAGEGEPLLELPGVSVRARPPRPRSAG